MLLCLLSTRLRFFAKLQKFYMNYRLTVKQNEFHIPAFYLIFLTLFSAVFFSSFPLSAQDPISLDKVNYIALSPEAAALHDAVNYPVEGNKGVPDISIPLYTIQYGKITIPIVLRYSTTNAKVDKSVAPNVGFGWVLDVGGSVNRVIKGKPDEASEWYQADGNTYFDQLRNSDDQYTISSIYGWHGSHYYDTEKDEFTMSTPSGAASFYLTESSGTYTGHFSPSVNWKVDRTTKYNGSGVAAMFTGLEILDGEGTRYRFGSGSSSTSPTSSDAAYIEYCTYDISGSGVTYATGWQLREAEDDAGNKVTFTYTRSGNYTYSSGQDQWYEITDDPNVFWTADASASQSYVASYNPDGRNTESPYSLTAFRIVYPSTIEWPQGKVIFFTSNNLISGLSIHDASGALVRSISFSTGVNNINTSSRLLSSVVVRNSDSTAVQTYSLTYNSVVTGTVNAPSCDWWGYFNGTTTNQNSFLPNRTITAQGYLYTTTFSLGNDGHREPDTTYIRHNILKTITYPGGGKTEFTFEPNTYTKERGVTVTAGTGPGLRIRTIQYKDKDGTVLRKLGYTYTGGNISVLPNTGYTTSIAYRLYVSEPSDVQFVVSDRTRTITPKYLSQVSGGGQAVDYDTVTETVFDGSMTVGLTVNTFCVTNNYQINTTGFLNASEAGQFVLNQYHITGESLTYNQSYILKKEEKNADGVVVRRTTYKYTRNANDTITNLGFYHLVYYDYMQSQGDADSGLIKDYWAIRRLYRLKQVDGIPPLYYYLYTSTRGYQYPAGETVETYAVANNGTVSTTNPFTVDRSIDYTTLSAWHYPVSVSTTRSDGRVSKVSYTYPFTAPSGYGAMKDSLVGRHIVGRPLSQTRWVGTTKIDSTLVVYGRYAGTTAPAGYFFRPSSMKYVKGTGSLMDTRITYASYDAWGNPRSIVYGLDDTEDYVWSYSHTTPVAKVTGATWSEVSSALGSSTLSSLEGAVSPADATVTSALTTLRGIANALTEGRTHKPFYGVSGEYDPSGRKQTYVYDKFQRLTTAKDNASKVKLYAEYKDATGAANSYVKVSTPDTALSSISSVAAAHRRTVARYYDGQYREKQSVQAYGSGTGRDLVLPFGTYDAWGRVTDTWLPYDTTSTGGAYRTGYAAEQSQYYTDRYGATDAAYARQRKEYESSPVGRVLKEYLPGAGGYLTHPVKHDYGVNAATDSVYRWNITASTSVVTRGSMYGAGTLSKEVVTDPDGRTTTTYTDREGRVVESLTGNYRTSYVYNDAGLLVAVIPPKARPSGTSLTSTLYYRYIYDSRNRLIESYVPDKGKTEFVYDADDRLVASRDAKESNDGKWHFFRFDRMGREVYSGLVASTSSAANLRSSYASQAFHETRVTSGSLISYTFNDTVLPVAYKDVLTVTYYDNYGYVGVKSFSAAGSDVGQSSTSVQSSAVKGLVTGRKAKVLDGMELMATGVMLTTSLYYNAAGDMIQEVGDIYTGGTAGTYRRSTLYRHQGEVAVTKESQTIGSATTTVLRKYSYDNAGRLTQILQGLNGGTPTLLETDTWDGVGRQATKVLGTGTQTVNYAWDIRDRLTSINTPSSMGTDKFGISYTYESGTTPQYGGNISGATWAHTGGSTQTYAYTYDTYGRLTAGTHSGGNSETAAYDPNGNLTSLTRTGTRAESLVYTYTSGTNKLGTLKSNGTNKTYAYDADGTMKTDGLRGLTVTYNVLKLPKTVASGTTSTVTYIYDAGGNKLAVSQDGTVKNYYCGDFVYTSGFDVDYILTPNGQMTRSALTGTYTAQYNITDHLGNVRSVVNSSGTVLQSTDYYPFGLAFSDANVTNNRYLYNGKELENYTIGSSYLGTLDYGARHYDARIGRWTVPDPMAESEYYHSAYSFCTLNPVNLIDPFGLTTYTIGNQIKEINDGFNEIISVTKKQLKRLERRFSISDNWYLNLRQKIMDRNGFITESGDYSLPTANIYASVSAKDVLLSAGALSLIDLSTPDITDASKTKLLAEAFLATTASLMNYEALMEKMNSEISSLQRRAPGPDAYQYALIATHSGYYPSYTYGKGSVFLNAGDVWKYGETIHPDSRYSQLWLKSNRLDKIIQAKGTQRQMKIEEKIKIYDYFCKNGHLPPGNKIFR